MARQTYQPQEWANLPSETTPISAERLTHMEQGITSAIDDRALKEIYDDDKINLPTTAMDASLGYGMIDITSKCSADATEQNVRIFVPIDGEYFGGFHAASGRYIGSITFSNRSPMLFVAQIYETTDGYIKQDVEGFAQLINMYSGSVEYGSKFDGIIGVGSSSTIVGHITVNAQIDFTLNTSSEIASYKIYKTYLPLPQQDLISKINSLEQRIEELEKQLG